MLRSLSTYLDSWLINSLGMDPENATILNSILLALVALLLSYLVWRICRWLLHMLVPKLTARTETVWDEVIFNRSVLNAIALLIPAMLLDYFAPFVFQHLGSILPVIKGSTDIIIVFSVAWIGGSIINSVNDRLAENPYFHDKPIGSFTQLGKIFIYGIAAILAISIVFGKSPIYLLSGIGAVAAVLLLVFKDSILGFVASIQLSANDMVHVGDWVTVPKYNADGDVLEINLTTIKVQNFDKTITTIPTYAFVSDSFTNWRGMEQSAGRRIKRAVHIKIGSIQFCTDEMIARFKKIALVKDYIVERQSEIDAYNAEHDFDGSVLVNGRKLTNIGVFKMYLENYLNASPSINSNMTIMVRQLPSTSEGLPVEMYAFSIHKEWKVYEGVIADLFDHIFAAASSFDLQIFEQPAGSDLQALK